MKDIRPTKLIHSEAFVKEPVNTACRKLEDLDVQNTILLGSGTGKSVLLNQMQERTFASEKPFFLAKFDSLSFSYVEKNPIYTDTFLRHCCEEQFVFQILWYIKNFYEISYHSYFTKYSDFIRESNEKTVNYINESVFEEQKPLNRLLSSQEIFGEILDLFKKYCYADRVRLGIDRFDGINSKRTQLILSEYFSLFSNTIITSDDVTLPQEWYKTYFKENSILYSFNPYNIEYGKDIAVVKSIIEKRIQKYNQEYFNENNRLYQRIKPFPMEFFTYEILELIVKKANGNISMIIDVVRHLISEWEWSERICSVDVEKSFNECIGKQRVLRKMDANPPKIYL